MTRSNSNFSDSLFYLHSATGLNVAMKMPRLDSLKRMFINAKKKPNILQAFIELPYDSSAYPVSAIKYLPFLNDATLQFKKDSAYNYYTEMFRPYNSFALDGTINTKDRTYKLNITQFVQDYVHGKTNSTDFILRQAANDNYAFCSILKKGKNIKLKIKYSKL